MLAKKPKLKKTIKPPLEPFIITVYPEGSKKEADIRFGEVNIFRVIKLLGMVQPVIADEIIDEARKAVGEDQDAQALYIQSRLNKYITLADKLVAHVEKRRRKHTKALERILHRHFMAVKDEPDSEHTKQLTLQKDILEILLNEVELVDKLLK